MCKVSCIITNDNIILTSSRDISINRPHSDAPKIEKNNGVDILMPHDPKGGGSWIGLTNSSIACLLNHEGKNNSLKSRGKLIVKLLSNQIDIHSIKPMLFEYNSFRLIYLDLISKEYYHCIWDSLDFKINKINDEVNIWLSTTIYSEKEIDLKTNFFLKNYSSNYSSEKLLKFHSDKKNIKNCKDIKTTSITQVSCSNIFSMYHKDLLNNKDYFLKLS